MRAQEPAALSCSKEKNARSQVLEIWSREQVSQRANWHGFLSKHGVCVTKIWVSDKILLRFFFSSSHVFV